MDKWTKPVAAILQNLTNTRVQESASAKQSGSPDWYVLKPAARNKMVNIILTFVRTGGSLLSLCLQCSEVFLTISGMRLKRIWRRSDCLQSTYRICSIRSSPIFLVNQVSLEAHDRRLDSVCMERYLQDRCRGSFLARASVCLCKPV